MSTVRAALAQAIQQLAAGDSPRLDAEVLLAHLLNKDRSWLYAHPQFELPADIQHTWQAWLARRATHEPVAYLTGERDFYGLTFQVSPAVLIPRPETELLVAAALAYIRPDMRVVDVGTGSGAIIVALAVNGPTAQYLATDISAPALRIARKNAARHGVAARVQWLQTDLLTALAGPFDLIVANPPYIAHAEFETLAPTVKSYEPPLALTDYADGLSLVRRLIQLAGQQLLTGGLLLIEIGATQGAATLAEARRLFPMAQTHIAPDLAGRDRLLVVQLI